MAVIVTAEDDPDIRQIITATLTRAGHRVIETADGAAALQEAKAHRPDLIVTDGDMPRMTGRELCHQVRAIPNLAQIPILVVSGSLTSAQADVGVPWASRCVTKPFTPMLLTDAVESLLFTRPAATGSWRTSTGTR